MNEEKTVNQVAEYNPLIAARAELLKKYDGLVYDVSIPEQYDNAELERKAMVKLSNQIEKVRKTISAPMFAAYNAVIATGNELAKPLDDRINELKKLIKAQNDKQALIDAELNKQIADIRATPMTMVGRSSDDMQEAHAALVALNAKDFDVYSEVAQNAINEALAQLEPMIAATVSNEVLARKQAEQQAILDARQAELDKAEREQQEKAAESKRLADLETARLQGIEQAKRDASALEESSRQHREAFEKLQAEANAKAEQLKPDQDKLKAWLKSCVDSAPVLSDEKLAATLKAIVDNFNLKIGQLK
jgi:septal ring factor EnvC (AmiA/AmiB activator)